jgi:hypothetical protein
VLGTLLLAFKGPHAGLGFLAYLVSNAFWIKFAADQGHGGLLAQHVVFAASSALGFYLWVVQPAVRRMKYFEGGP